MAKPIYVLGTGLSHDGSSCLLKNGKICAAIEKERITRIKHDQGSDTEAIKYCLEKEGISLDDIDLIVQNSPTGIFDGPRIVENKCRAPIVTISHHLAHAYSAYGTSDFDDCAVLVLDGTGSSLNQCTDLVGNFTLCCDPMPNGNEDAYKENNSYYHFKNGGYSLICKEASRLHKNINGKDIRTYAENSIGDFYSAASGYCFKDMFDAGKLMGLAPYGNPSVYNDEAFSVRDRAIILNHNLLDKFTNPSKSHAHFKENFQYYADIANWAQRELERAITFIINSRYNMFPSENLAYCGGVALNAVMNSKILRESPFKNLYIQPAAADNGTSLGCAFYGWLNIMKMPKVFHGPSTCFGKVYTTESVKTSFRNYHNDNPVRAKEKIDTLFQELPLTYKSNMSGKDNILLQVNIDNAGINADVEMKPINGIGEEDYLRHIHYEGEGYIEEAARLLSIGKVIAWFQDESEFGPRALGRRSILADPRKKGIKDFINAEIKFREDFRPFAPSVIREDLQLYFEDDVESPHMLMINKIRDEWKETVSEIVHVDGTCRVQTITPDWNPKYFHLIKEFKKITGISVLLNTSFNGVSMPIVETPDDAFRFFYAGKLDYLVIQNLIIKRNIS